METTDTPKQEVTENKSQGNMWQKMFFWKLAIAKCSGKALMAFFFSIVATLNGVEWNEFLPTQKFVAVIAALGAMWTVIDAFLSDTMTKLSEKAEAEKMDQKNG